MSERLSAEEFAAKSTEERDWAIYDSLGEGQDTMMGLRTDVDKNTHAIEDVGNTLNGHINDRGAHPIPRRVKSNPGNPGNPGVKSRIKERKWQAVVGIVTIISSITVYHFGG